MALGARQQVTAAGITPGYAPPLASQTIVVKGGGTMIHVKNANGSALTVTAVDAGVTPAGSVATNPTWTVPATTGDKMIYVSPKLADPATGVVTITTSVQSSVSMGIFRLGS